MSEKTANAPTDFFKPPPVLPAYQKFPDAKDVVDCGCFINGNGNPGEGPASAALNKTIQGSLKQALAKLKADKNNEVLMKFLNLRLRTPLFIHKTEENPTDPKQKVKLNKKIKKARKEAKQAYKDAAKAQKKARKAKAKAEKIESKAVATDKMLKDAKEKTDHAMAEIRQAKMAHGRAVKWAAAVGQGAQETKRMAKDALKEAEMIYDKTEFCDHLV